MNIIKIMDSPFSLFTVTNSWWLSTDSRGVFLVNQVYFSAYNFVAILVWVCDYRQFILVLLGYRNSCSSNYCDFSTLSNFFLGGYYV